MSVDGISCDFKKNIKSSLLVAHQLTEYGESPCEQVLNRMNAVLGAVVSNNFGSESLSRVGELYEAIGKLQSAFMDSQQNLAFVNFARSFAVVLEESIRKEKGRGNTKQKGTDIKNVPALSSIKPAAAIVASYSVQLGFGQPARPAAVAAAAAMSGFKSGTASNGSPATPFKGFGTSKLATGPTRAAPPAAAARHSDELDFSPEGIKGRVKVENIPIVVCKQKLEEFMHQIAPTLSLSYPQKPDGTPRGIAYVKYASNEMADQAVKELDGMGFCGYKVTVSRVKFWFKRTQDPSKKTIDIQPRSITIMEGSVKKSMNNMNKWEENKHVWEGKKNDNEMENGEKKKKEEKEENEEKMIDSDSDNVD